MIRTRHFLRAHRSVTIALATASFSAVLLCSGLLDTAASAQSLDAVPDAAPGVITIGSSATSAAPGEGVFISVHRGEGTDGEVSVSVDSQQLPAELAAVIAPIHTQVTFLDGEGEDKTIPIVFLGDEQPGVQGDAQPAVPPFEQPTVPPVQIEIDPGLGLGGGGVRAATSAASPGAVSRAIAAAEGSSAPLTVSLSAPTGGAQIGTPSSVTVSIAVPPTTTPVDGGTETPDATTGDTTQPGTSSKNSSGTTVPVGGGKSLAASGINALPQIVTAILVASAGLAALLFVRRRRSSDAK